MSLASFGNAAAQTAPFLGEIRWAGYAFPPKGWALCNGQLLAINQNQALFALLGTTYGGDGRTTFALPNLQGRVPIHFSGAFPLGSTGGEAQHSLTVAEMPAHTHSLNVGVNADTTTHVAIPDNSHTYFVQSKDSIFEQDPGNLNVNGVHITDVSSAGISVPHENMPPYLVLNAIIALQGIFPSRS